MKTIEGNEGNWDETQTEDNQYPIIINRIPRSRIWNRKYRAAA